MQSIKTSNLDSFVNSVDSLYGGKKANLFTLVDLKSPTMSHGVPHGSMFVPFVFQIIFTVYKHDSTLMKIRL